MSRPAPHGERVDDTYERLRDAIVRGRLAPRERITEAALAVQFGVSRTPIRAALDRLMLERFVVPASTGLRVELMVASLTGDDIRELWQLIGALEGAAASGVNDLGRNALHVLADTMDATNEELARLTHRRPRDIDRIGELMSVFHILYMDACAGPRIRSLHTAVLPHVQRYEWAYDAVHDYAPSVDEHRRISSAIRLGDARRVRRAVEQHWENGMQRRLAQLRAVTE